MKLIDIISESVIDLNELSQKWTSETKKQSLIDNPDLSDLDFKDAEVAYTNMGWMVKNFSCKIHPEWTKENFTDIGNIERGTSKCKFCSGLSISKKRFEQKKYTKELLRDIALKYETRKKFEKANQPAYQAAVSFGPCYDKTTGEEVRCKYYNKDKQSTVYRPNTKNTFGFIDDICSHMKFGGFYGEKFIYSYTFFDDKNDIVGIYVGLTNDEERRKQQHLSPKENEAESAVSKFIKENPNFTYRYKKLTNMVNFDLAKKLESYHEEKYKSKGYRILNIAKTGGGGRTFIPHDYYIEKAQKWVDEKLKKGETPYVGDYLNFDPSNYKTIRTKKLMDLAFNGMEYRDKKKYSNQDIINTAMSCDSYRDFFKKFEKNIWQQASRRFMLDDIKQMFNGGLNKIEKIKESNLSFKNTIIEMIQHDVDEIATKEKELVGKGAFHNVYPSNKNPNMVYKIGFDEDVNGWVDLFKSRPDIFPKVYGTGYVNIKLKKQVTNFSWRTGEFKPITYNPGDTVKVKYVGVERLNTEKAKQHWNSLANVVSTMSGKSLQTYLTSLGMDEEMEEEFLSLGERIKEMGNDFIYNIFVELYNLVHSVYELKPTADVHVGNYGYDKDGNLKCLDI